MDQDLYDLASQLAHEAFPGKRHAALRATIRRHAEHPRLILRLARGRPPTDRALLGEIADRLAAAQPLPPTTVCPRCGLAHEAADAHMC